MNREVVIVRTLQWAIVPAVAAIVGAAMGEVLFDHPGEGAVIGAGTALSMNIIWGVILPRIV